MLILANVIALAIAAMGLIIAIRPDILKKILNFWKEGKRAYLAGVMRLVFGVIFLFAAQGCKFPALIFTIGALALIGAAVIFLVGPDKIKPILGWWEKKPPLVIRIMGTAAFIIGALIFYSI